MFRCPNCGKVHKMKLSHSCSLLADKNMNRLFVVPNDFYKDGNLAKAFASLHEVATINEAVIYIKNKFGEECVQEPECSCCNESADVFDWINAFENPIDFFDAENLCSCGSELWMDNIPNTRQYGLVCEGCGWVKPKSTVSTSADVTV